MVEVTTDGVEIFGDRADLRGLARWCLAMSDALAPGGSHIHLDPGIGPLSLDSAPLMIARQDNADDRGGPTF